MVKGRVESYWVKSPYVDGRDSWLAMDAVETRSLPAGQEVYVIPTDKVKVFEAGTDYQTIAEHLMTSYGKVLIVECEG